MPILQFKTSLKISCQSIYIHIHLHVTHLHVYMSLATFPVFPEWHFWRPLLPALLLPSGRQTTLRWRAPSRTLLLNSWHSGKSWWTWEYYGGVYEYVKAGTPTWHSKASGFHFMSLRHSHIPCQINQRPLIYVLHQSVCYHIAILINALPHFAITCFLHHVLLGRLRGCRQGWCLRCCICGSFSQ